MYANDQDWNPVRHILRVICEITEIAARNDSTINEFDDVINNTKVTVVVGGIQEMSEFDSTAKTIEKCNKPREIYTMLNNFIVYYTSILD